MAAYNPGVLSLNESLDAISEQAIRDASLELLDLAHGIHSNPEAAFEEVYASDLVARALEQHGFEVTRGAANLQTAVIGRLGGGTMKIAVFAEYDALPEIGHACGHNVIAAAAVGAGIGLAAVADAVDVEVVIVGSPAEERGGGKITLLESGALDGVDLALMIHPAPFDVVAPPILALHWMEVTYRGRAAHASAFPELGVNAGDAAVVAQTAIGLARQHLSPKARVHGIVTSAGTAANVIPDLAQLSYMVRAPHVDLLAEAVLRVVRCFEAGSVATGAALELSDTNKTYAHMEHDVAIGAIYRNQAERLGRVFFDGEVAPVSTDMGNISLAIPSIHPFIGIDSLPAVNHQPEFTTAAGSPAADRAVIDGALAMAWTVIDLATDEVARRGLLARAGLRRRAWMERLPATSPTKGPHQSERSTDD